jgi:hypothetical protein
MNLETKLLEEVLGTSLVLSRFTLSLLSVSVLEYLLHGLDFLSVSGLVDSLFQIHIGELVSRRHDVVEVHGLDERFDLRSLFDSLLLHGSRNFSRVSIDSSDETMSELLVIRTVLIYAHNDSFTSGVSSIKAHYNLSFLDHLYHRVIMMIYMNMKSFSKIQPHQGNWPSSRIVYCVHGGVYTLGGRTYRRDVYMYRCIDV